LVRVAGCEMHHTNLEAKQEYCRENGIHVDIWIDDDPINIFESGKCYRK
jgi:hypothetical protein